MLLFPLDIPVQKINHPLFIEQHIEVNILRLDRVHPIVSGNKLFKLHYFLKEAELKPGKAIVTFGGAYSNHLIATAFACKKMGIQCIGIVRGESAAILSPTLQQCIAYGMQLIFVSRELYHHKNEPAFLKELNINVEDCIVIPEGGYHPLGAKGASLIMNSFTKKDYTHICTAVGTATTLAGLLMEKTHEQQIIGFSVLKGLHDMDERIKYLTGKSDIHYKIISEYHFGGYAKKTNQLIDFMNTLWKEHQLPTDFVYTSKMIFGIFDRIEKRYFPENSKICILHTGGLQGNNSLPIGTLTF
jgi:1-aminocyclopropane-1-carboxylate deaminase/D-cysteine desulfhydrase-like pyridoxal-dependent ACC family enzyme